MDIKSPMNDAGSASVCIGLMDPASGSFVRVRRCNRSKTSLTRFVPDNPRDKGNLQYQNERVSSLASTKL